MKRLRASALGLVAAALLPAGLLAQTPTISIQDVQIIEGDVGLKDAVFFVNLSATSTFTITVNYTTVDGSATVADNDYQPRSGILTIFAGEASKTIAVPIVGDFKAEQDETFFVVLSNPINATIARGEATGTIVNDDGSTPTNTATNTFTPTRTATPTPSLTPSVTPTPTKTPTPTSTPTPSPTPTPSFSPTRTNTSGPSPTPSRTPTPTQSPTPTLTPTPVPRGAVFPVSGERRPVVVPARTPVP